METGKKAAPKASASGKVATAGEKRFAGFVGVVESDKRDKTRTVVVRFATKHPKYGKYIRHKTTLQAHDEGNASKAGDTVEISPCRPVSKTKTWRVTRVVESKAV
jgi:small subunit ribosomal protein S17